MTSLMIPNSSKYPPLPCVPKGSLKVMVTLAMESRFQVGPKIMFEKRSEIRFWTISLPAKSICLVLFQWNYLYQYKLKVIAYVMVSVPRVMVSVPLKLCKTMVS